MAKRKNLVDRIVPIVLILAIALAIFGNLALQERGVNVVEAKKVLEEEMRPAELQIIKLTFDCDFCFDITSAIDSLKNQNINITEEETISSNSDQGKEIIEKYGIEKLPTIIVSGETNKSEQLAKYFEDNGKIQDKNFVYSSQTSPYFDTKTNKITGLVNIINIIDSSCTECTDISLISSAIKGQGIYVENEQSIEYNSKEGQKLIKELNIKEIPAILISNEISYYSNMEASLVQSGATKNDEFYVIPVAVPPYRSLEENKVVGFVDVIYLTKNDCPVCYNVSVNKNILLNFGIAIKSENTYDISSPEGEKLVQKYNIKKAPIIITSPDSKYYPSLVNAWGNVGTIENDGWFVMRNPEIIGTYWDIKNNRAI
jgi:hypothetical protein